MALGSFNATLQPGEIIKIAGPGKVEFSATKVAEAAVGKTATAATNAAVAGKTAGAAKTGGIVGIVPPPGTSATVAAAATNTSAVGTIWTGKGLSLGLGLGLGAWGPVLVVGGAALAWYAYKRKQENQKIWPFTRN
ncbi:MAG: hypothetical protein HQL55_18040 [Magnetococcales bacterium]|nr:hypothetical protein [Magnetococcales bacterium]